MMKFDFGDNFCSCCDAVYMLDKPRLKKSGPKGKEFSYKTRHPTLQQNVDYVLSMALTQLSICETNSFQIDIGEDVAHRDGQIRTCIEESKHWDELSKHKGFKVLKQGCLIFPKPADIGDRKTYIVGEH